MYCYTHCCHHCPWCHPHVHAPNYWCSTCARYTYTLHNHHWVQSVWPPPAVRPIIICGPQERDRRTIHALAG